MLIFYVNVDQSTVLFLKDDTRYQTKGRLIIRVETRIPVLPDNADTVIKGSLRVIKVTYRSWW